MTDPQARELGAFVREKRDQRALTLVQLEAMTGIPDSWLYHFEKGHYTTPAPDRLAKLADALDIDAAYIDRISSDHLADSLPGTRSTSVARRSSVPRPSTNSNSSWRAFAASTVPRGRARRHSREPTGHHALCPKQRRSGLRLARDAARADAATGHAAQR